jgi:hypothetical protein
MQREPTYNSQLASRFFKTVLPSTGIRGRRAAAGKYCKFECVMASTRQQSLEQQLFRTSCKEGKREIRERERQRDSVHNDYC